MSVTDQRFCYQNLWRSKSYWIAMRSAQSLFEGKGVTQVLHDRPYGYYECLLQLSAEQLQPLLADANFQLYNNKEYLQVLKGVGIQAGPLAGLAGAESSGSAKPRKKRRVARAAVPAVPVFNEDTPREPQGQLEEDQQAQVALLLSALDSEPLPCYDLEGFVGYEMPFQNPPVVAPEAGA